MKQLFLTITTLLFLTNSYGQKTEFFVNLNSGLFSFSGISTHRTTSINYDDRTNSGYTNNPWGSKKALCYGVSISIDRVTKKNFILGLNLGYESLRSKISINNIDGYDGYNTYQLSATGQTFLENNFINYNPFLGYRLNLKNISFDLVGGFEIGQSLNTTEDGKATDTNGKKYTTSEDRKTITLDFRPRIQFSTEYKNIVVYIGYSYGLTNYMMWTKGDGIWESYARLIRFGVTYQIK